ncbi:hypothetical protein SAMN04488535_0257 [Corynebacterium mycetoides]|uniref:Uncharacterized protein n=1 Tax=Corynebacterium mycetoides TaxID=38302 RepID=A0A1G9LPY1_9CORY|nr:hypothetical protein [Corynebacterium mycetoides]SDL63867.1 hypothetical protein SAMN04488535_0257 [Corynebacterium mycetoides]
MNGSTVYPLAPSAWGAAEEIPVDNVVQAFVVSDTPSVYGTSYINVHLEPDPLTGGWRVRSGDSVIGGIAASHRSRFTPLERVHGSGLVPATLAGVRLDPALGRFAVDVFLPPALVSVPRNNAPTGAVVLPPGDMFVVDTSAGEFTGGELDMRSPGQWLVGLTVLGDAVVATLDGRVLGTFSDQDNTVLSAFVGEETVFARAHIVDGMVGLDVSEPSPDPDVVPPLTIPADEPKRAWTVTTFPDGTWSITVERNAAVDADDISTPTAHSRPVSSPTADGATTAPAPSVDFTPTTSFRASSATYLTEMEKLRLRREHQGRSRGGRHRRRHP